MSTQIKSWQVTNGKLRLIETNLAQSGRREAEHLESWIESEPTILGSDIILIGRQVTTDSGPLDLLGIDRNGNVVVIELKRDRLPREALAQAIDYASDVATWSVEQLSEVCVKYTTQSLEDLITGKFDDIDIENFTINEDQRILLVGFGASGALERMIEWLSSSYGVNVNAIVLHYAKTVSGDELLTKTVIISEEEEKKRVSRRKIKVEMSDEPGDHDSDELRRRLTKYLSQSDGWTSRRVHNVLLPACLEHSRVTRDQLVQEFLKRGFASDESKAGRGISYISTELGRAANDYLRQVIGYEYPDYEWKKDNYHIRDGYRSLVEEILEDLEQEEDTPLSELA